MRPPIWNFPLIFVSFLFSSKGIFRVSGNQTEVQQLKDAFDKGDEVLSRDLMERIFEVKDFGNES
jgi:hypothetical protein